MKMEKTNNSALPTGKEVTGKTFATGINTNVTTVLGDVSTNSNCSRQLSLTPHPQTRKSGLKSADADPTSANEISASNSGQNLTRQKSTSRQSSSAAKSARNIMKNISADGAQIGKHRKSKNKRHNTVTHENRKEKTPEEIEISKKRIQTRKFYYKHISSVEMYKREEFEKLNEWIFDNRDDLDLVQCKVCGEITKFICEHRLINNFFDVAKETDHTVVPIETDVVDIEVIPTTLKNVEIYSSEFGNVEASGQIFGVKNIDDSTLNKELNGTVIKYETRSYNGYTWNKGLDSPITKYETKSYSDNPWYKGLDNNQVIIKDESVYKHNDDTPVVRPSKTVNNKPATDTIAMRAKWYNRLIFGKTSSKFNFDNKINHQTGTLLNNKIVTPERENNLLISDEHIVDGLFIYLRRVMHVSYPSRDVKIEHAQKLANRWVEENDYDITTIRGLNEFLITIQKAVDQKDNYFLYQEETQALSRKTRLGFFNRRRPAEN
jgi:hypothetical protein